VKIWLTQSGDCVVEKKAKNKDIIHHSHMERLLAIICAKHNDICEKWKEYFNTEDIEFYC
jgi:hypothetical protein